MARIPRCCGSGVGRGYSSNSTPGLGTSVCHGSGPRKSKKTNKQTNKKQKHFIKLNFTFILMIIKNQHLILFLKKCQVRLGFLISLCYDNIPEFSLKADGKSPLHRGQGTGLRTCATWGLPRWSSLVLGCGSFGKNEERNRIAGARLSLMVTPGRLQTMFRVKHTDRSQVQRGQIHRQGELFMRSPAPWPIKYPISLSHQERNPKRMVLCPEITRKNALQNPCQ